MGNEQSSVAETGTDAQGGSHFGFRVLGIQENSPASVVGFVSFFDFILSANGIRLDTKDSTFMELIARSEDTPMQLVVYNVKSQTTRDLFLTPSRNWPGKGMLGVTIRFDSFEGAEDHILHILEVATKSPADVATLQSDTDYLLGTPERVFRGTLPPFLSIANPLVVKDPEDLYDEIIDHLDQPFQCYVYNAKSDQVRIVRITPHDRWGGDGYLGAEVGHGFLHRLPTSVRDTPGLSIGFVSISATARAATDQYASHKPAAAPTDDPAAVEDSVIPPTTTEEATAAPVPATDVPVDPPVVEAAAPPSLDVPAPVAPPVAVEQMAQVPKAPAPPVAVPSPAATISSQRTPGAVRAASPFPPVGFAGFPISTIETYVDPNSPRALTK
ncbi:Aste57867_25330 [Aphanomyces stellatus]|uniref:Aste57867_25330 protein n=1 Tax=Aphanomyces stellatus TaxID=120398 RepID=A0A485LSX5_9STRA|nr:hypothetical protein As57867_025252 [Aphanomyces stellatus]VFU01955.1 Aste57867_25330 [Aphanomyces stellatus]